MTKRLRFSLVLLLVLTVFASCKQNHFCYCSYLAGGTTVTPLPTVIIYQTNAHAEEECKNRVALFVTKYPTTTCEIK